MRLCYFADGEYRTRDVVSVRDAQDHVRTLLAVGSRGVTAEVIDADGEVVADFATGKGWRLEGVA